MKTHTQRLAGRLVLVVAVLSVGCVRRYALNGPESGESSPPSVADSVVTAPVEVDLTGARTLLLQEIPNPLAAGSARQKIPVHITVVKLVKTVVDVPRTIVKKVLKKVPTSVRAAGCLFNPVACITTILVDKWVDEAVMVIEKVEQVVSTPVNELSPLDVEVEYGATLADFDFDVQGNILTARATIDAFVNGKLDASVTKVGVASCGVGEEKPRIQITVSGPVRWSEEGKLLFDRQDWKVAWLRPCNLTAFDISAEDLLQLPVIKDLVNRKIESGLSKLPTSYSLRPALETAWKKTGQPMRLDDEVWLQLHPISLSIGSLNGRGKVVSTVVSMIARPQIVYGQAPAPIEASFPGIGLTVPETKRFSVAVTGEANLRDAEAVLARELTVKPFDIQGHKVQIDGVRLYGGASGNLVVALKLSRPFIGEIYLVGTPVFDRENEIIKAESLDFSLETRNLLVATADYLLHESFRQLIQSKARFPVAPVRRKAETALQRHSFSGDGYEVRVVTEAMRLMGVYIGTDDLKVVGHAEGTAEASFRL